MNCYGQNPKSDNYIRKHYFYPVLLHYLIFIKKLSKSENLPREWLIEIYENTLMWSSLHAEEHLSWAAYPTAVMPHVFNQYWTALLLSCGLGYSMKAKNRANHEQKWNWRKENSRAIEQGQKNVSMSCLPQHSTIPIYLPLTKPPTRLS